MSVLDRPELVPVPLGYCPCEGSPHPDGDTVYLYPDLSMAGGMAARSAIIEASGSEYVQLQLNEFLAHIWVRYAVAEWTFLDDDGEPIPVTAENVRIALPYGKGGRLVADKADDLYAEAVTAPLVERVDERSKRGSTPTRARTSRTPTTPQKQPSPSSTATTDRVPPAG